MQDIPLDVAHFVGLLVALFLYGVFFVMFTLSIRPLWNRRHRSKFVVVVTICVFVIATVNIGIYISMNHVAFTKHGNSAVVVAYLKKVYSPMIPLRTAFLPDFFLAAAAITSDILLIWRLYIIWSRNLYVVMAPILLLVLETATELFLVVEAFLHTEPGQRGFPGVVIVCAISIGLLNVICTASIVGRLWWIGGRHTQPRDTRSLYKTIVTRMIESGTLYTLSLLVFAAFSTLGTYPGISTLLGYMFTMIAAIAPMLLVLHLNTTIFSEAHVIEDEVTGESRLPTDTETHLPRRRVGIASTTIAFAPMTYRTRQHDPEIMVDLD
ncbi:hypothetical protein FRB94_004956 [Tulasnella sp. JGI-2019a]|nr:hypothetical protein FRB93_005769 [Tulasnella sp. JGI-2019a]KAG9001024.1 hypothetical protein FRB94_004956 [Tulasnella sp. JGI-2019a]KAG9029181.1 hypothetical protein FRB95_005595 [Tulasnella sp. JGI-2019a]